MLVGKWMKDRNILIGEISFAMFDKSNNKDYIFEAFKFTNVPENNLESFLLFKSYD